MPFVLLIIGELLLVTGVKGTQDQLYSLVQDDFTGSGSFIYWLAAIGLVGSLGYVPSLKGFSNAFLILILIVLLIHQNPQTLFGNISSALSGSTTAAPATTQAANTSDGGNTQQTLQQTTQNLTKVAENLASAFG